MHKLFFWSCFVVTAVTNIYSYSFIDVDGNTVNMSAFSGKKILIVNTASSSEKAGQYAEMETLQQLYKDSLVVIAFPSNSFGNEALPDSEIKAIVDSIYNTHFIIASKTEVAGENQNPIFQWLTRDSLNGVLNSPVYTDFYKFLIDSEGNLMGEYNGEVSPTDPILRAAIEGTLLNGQ